MNLIQTFCPVLVERILTDDSILSFIIDDSVEDPVSNLLNIVNNTDNICLKVLMDDGQIGGIIFYIKVSPTTYEIHVNLLPFCRKKLAIDAVNLSFRFMFELTDCTKIIARCPVNMPQVRKLADVCCMRFEYSTQKSYLKKGQYYNQDHMAITISEYIWTSDYLYRETGKKLISSIDQYKEKASLNNDCHEVISGFYLNLIQNRNYDKAQTIYNEWAAVSGHQTIAHLMVIPDGRLLVNDGEINYFIDHDSRVTTMSEE